MKIEFIKRGEISGEGREENPAKRLILIFAGWGSDPQLYKDIEIEGWDTAVAYDYRDLEFETVLLQPYSVIYLYAWSMGVWAASAISSKIQPDAAFAINGTRYPRSDRYGIPEAIYDGTLESLNERNLKKFRLRMAGDRETATHLESLLPAPDIEGLQEELRIIRAMCAGGERGESPRDVEGIRWNRAYISKEDRIFPTESQRRHWEREKVETIMLPGAHFTDFNSIVKTTISDLSRVGARFGKALPTYDAHAHAQREIAARLTEMLADRHPSNGGVILEIGSGSGLFTHMYAPLMRASSATYLDLYPMPEYREATREQYHIGDAERWISGKALEEHPDRYDAILSASTIQWFASPRKFFRNAALLMREGGILAVSTFGKRNLKELEGVRPSPIIYRDIEELREMAEAEFSDVRIEELEIPLRFAGSREALLHLKHTGVGGSVVTGRQGAGISASLSTAGDGTVILTYHAIFITGRKQIRRKH